MAIWTSLKRLDWIALLAELVLVFVGITAALWFDNWNADRKDRRLEADLLAEIAHGLEADTADLHFNLRSSARTRASIDTILAYFDQRLPYRAELANHFGLATRFTNFIQNMAAYEQLKAAGLEVIRNDSLRLGIITYYETGAGLLHGSEQTVLNRHFETIMQPQMIEKFSYEGFLRPAVPHDYEELRSDRSFRSALTTQRGYLAWKDSNTRALIRSAEDLLAAIRARSR